MNNDIIDTTTTKTSKRSVSSATTRAATVGMAGLLLLGGAALGAPAMAAGAAPTGDGSAVVAGSQQGKRQVTLKAPRSATTGTKVTLKGKVKKNRHHKTRVVIQQKHGKKWQKVDATKTNKKGKFNTSDVLKGKKKVTLRAKAKGHGVSATQTVTLTKATNGNNTPATPAQPAQPATPGGNPGTSPTAGGDVPKPAPDPMSITVAAGNAQALRDAITQAPNGATLHLSGQYNLTTEMTGPGGYAAGIVIDKKLTLDGPNATLTTQQRDNVVDVTKSGDLTLTGGITITDGQATVGSGSYSSGGGIYNDGVVDIKNAVITDSTADWGGGIANNTGATLTMEGGTISGNTSDRGAGGGIVNNTGAILTMEGGTISDNTAEDGGGFYNAGGTFTLNSGSISGNRAGNRGGGIYDYYGGTLNLNGGTISDNTAEDGGGIYSGDSGAKVNLTDNATVNGNTAKTGGGVSAESGTLYMNGNRVTDLSPDKTTISKAVYGNDGFPEIVLR